jgi:hypothetical protein
MLFKFKTKPIVVDAFVNINAINELYPIKHSKKFFPSWWKGMPSSGKDENQPEYSTIKRCDGLINLYQEGFIVPLWTDLYVKTSSNGDYWWKSADKSLSVEIHGREVFPAALDNKLHMKLLNPWRIKEKSGVNFLYTNNWWAHPDAPVTIPNGILEFKYQTASHINLFLDKKDQEFMVEAGTPICQLVALSERPVTVKTHYLGEEEYNKIERDSTFLNSFVGKYKKKKKIMKQNEQSKCPFHRFVK